MLTPDEQRIYLLNVVYVAKADEIVELEENEVMQRVCDEIGASREDLAHALAADRESIQLDFRPFARYSTRARCLEDMIELAMADGDVALNEKKVLLVAAQEAGIAKELVGTLVRETAARQRG